MINPYVKKQKVAPKSGAAYLDRTKNYKGIIVKNDNCHRAFVSNGWKWGGAWRTVKDYQHFEKKSL